MRTLKPLAFLLSFLLAGAAGQAAAEDRIALVIGQGAYESGRLPTTVNDAGLVAQTLTSAGFEVIQGGDLGANDLRRVVRDFLDKVEDAEPDSSIVVYLSGHGIQLEGENYLLPVDARIQRDADVALEGFRISDLVRSLAGAPAQTRIVIADLGREFPLASNGQPIAKGLALVEPPEGFLIALSSSPNITVTDGKGPYGPYATALVEMIRQPGLRVEDVFSRVRLRTHEATAGAQTPWHASNLKDTFIFFEPTETASAEPPAQPRRIADAPPEEAYSIAIERDSIPDYQEFLRRNPDHRQARRVKALLAARREAIVWRQTVNRNSSEAYWTYLRRYPNGPHAADSRRRLVRLSAPVAPPSAFEEVVYEDLPPPLPEVETIEMVDVVTIVREVPPPPPPPIYLLPERDFEDEYIVTVISEPPPPPILVGVLPIPYPIPIPYRARPPRVFYQPIAPATPRGVVAIPVARPILQEDRPRRPAGTPRPPRPRIVPEGSLPGQPGVIAPARPIPVAAAPRDVRDVRPRPGVRPDDEPRRPRLPRIPVGSADVRGVDRPARAPARATDEPGARPAVPDRPSPIEGRPARPGVDARDDRPNVDRPDRPDRPARPSVETLRPSSPPPGTRLPGRADDRPNAPARPGADEDGPRVVRPDRPNQPDRPDRPNRAAPEIERPDRPTPRVPDRAVRPQPDRPDRPEPRIERAVPRIDRPEPRIERAVPRPERAAPRIERPEPRFERPDRPAPRLERPEPRIERPMPRIERPEPRIERAVPRERPEPRMERPMPRMERPERPPMMQQRPMPMERAAPRMERMAPPQMMRPREAPQAQPRQAPGRPSAPCGGPGRPPCR